MKKAKIIFWVTTSIIVLSEGLIPALTFNIAATKEAITHLGYPIYFGYMLTVFKVLGALALIIPKVPSRIKEWAYAGFGFDFIAAFVSIWAVDGFGGMLVLPVVFLAILKLSYTNYHKLNTVVS